MEKEQKEPQQEQKPPLPPEPPDLKKTPPRKPQDAVPEPVNARGMLTWFVVFSLLITMFFFWRQNKDGYEKMNYSPDFMALVAGGKIKSCEIVRDASGVDYIRGDYYLKDANTPNATAKFKVIVRAGDRLEQYLGEHNINWKYVSGNPYFWSLVSSVLPVVLIFGFLYFLIMRQMRAAGHGALSFGKSRAKQLNRAKNKVTFANVAGIDEAKEEVEEIVEFLKDPKKFTMLGGRIPKGVLLMGQPGTGKTLLARAIAGEADVPFFNISGSDFVEMFVGVGASRVRDMFEQGKKSAPCIIFIDEIDAVGRSRFTGIGGGHDEREQTLNALLVEMDGFESQEGVIILAATNRPDVLDPALMRPGRFDRQIVIDLPMIDGREAILKIHSKNIKLSKDVDLRRLARGTPGFSGADLENLLNEAALLAARSSKEAVETKHLEEARDKVKWGRERRSRVLGDKEKKITAYHESGHALVMFLVEESEPLHKITIIPRGVAYLGATMQLPEKDQYLESKTKLEGILAGMMGGRVAEETVFNEMTTGASSDLKAATHIARQMICQWGMSENMGPQTYGENEELMFLGREISRTQNYSEETAKKIDAEIRGKLEKAYNRAKDIIINKRDKLEKIAELLLERETLEGRDVDEIMEYSRILSDEERAKADAEKNKLENGGKTVEKPEKQVIGSDDKPGN